MKTIQPWTGLAAILLGIVTGPVLAEEIATVKENRVNVRGQASLLGEVITQLKKGEQVVVLEEITLPKPKQDEPAKWLRIRMPANTPVWVYAPYIDTANRSVSVSRVNLRAGPGENFSVVGRLERGESVKDIRTVEDWMEIEPPSAAFAFVAADLVTRTPSAPTAAEVKTPAPPPAEPKAPTGPPPAQPKTEPPVVAAPPPKTEPETETAKVVPPVVIPTPPAEDRPAVAVDLPPPTPTPPPSQPAPPVETPKPAVTEPEPEKPEPSPTPVVAPAATPPPVVAPPPVEVIAPSPAETGPPPKRIVRREGIVRSTRSIQAPTYFELIHPQTKAVINYLHTDEPQLKLKDYRGKKIVVTGEEGIDPRWPTTPLIEIQTLELAP